MTSEKNTIPASLATVKHGGCVQLADSERERFEAWAEPRKHTLTRWGNSPGEVSPLFVNEVAGNYISPAAQAAWEAWQHLSAQPSPGGQGDALELLEAYDQAVEDLSVERSDGWNEDNRRPQLEADVAELRAELIAALAARQPVGGPVLYQIREVVRGDEDEWFKSTVERRQTWREIPKAHYDVYVSVMGGSGPMGVIGEPLGRVALEVSPYGPRTEVRALYAAPPAQAVDLGEIIEQIAQQWDGCNYDAVGETIDVGREIRSAGKRLIDSQAVGNG